MRIKIFIFLAIAALCCSLRGLAQSASPIEWRVSVKMTSEKEGTLIMKAIIEPGWHLYGMELPDGGPKPTVFDLSGSQGIQFEGNIIPSFLPKEVNDKMFGMKLNWWDKTVSFSRRFKVVNPATAKVNGKITYMSCDSQTCMPPKTETFSKSAKYYKK